MTARRLGTTAEVNRQRLRTLYDNWVAPTFNPFSFMRGGGSFGGEWAGGHKSSTLRALRDGVGAASPDGAVDEDVSTLAAGALPSFDGDAHESDSDFEGGGEGGGEGDGDGNGDVAAQGDMGEGIATSPVTGAQSPATRR